MTRLVAIVQARLGSTRLPGKVLQEAGGRTILEHVAKRVALTPGLSELVVAIPDNPGDDLLAEAVRKLPQARLFRGSERDVLDRYYQAARIHRADRVLRATADCPLLDPRVAGRVALALDQAGVDIAENSTPPTFPHGLDVEAYPMAVLETAWREAKLAEEREHVSPFIRNHPERFRRFNVASPGHWHHHRWTVDEPADLEFARAVFAALGPDAGISLGYEEILRFVESHPEIAKLNAHVGATHVWDEAGQRWKLRAP